jgi:2-oxoglutarate ferredoxin oxidoreductase subunit alpha
LNEHLWRKIDDCRAEIELAQADCQPHARTLLVSYGITARAMTEAMQTARDAGYSVSTLCVQTLWPVPENALLEAVENARGTAPIERIVVAELNLGDFRREVERVVYRWAAREHHLAPEIIGVNRVDGELIAPEQLLARIC